MAETTGISWTDATINFWHGCQKVSEGCKFCYMFRDKERYKQDGSKVVKTGLSTIKGTLSKLRHQWLERRASGNLEPLKIFTCSWSDFFIEQADGWREEAWQIIRQNPQYVWQILTKRPERIAACLPPDWGEGWPNVWLGVSAENQARWNERVPILLDIPAKVRFVSAEPLLGPIVPKMIDLGRLDWVILGGESGNDSGPWGYRPATIPWFAALARCCEKSNVEFFVKQLGTHLAKELNLKDRAGANPEEWGPGLRVQKFPR